MSPLLHLGLYEGFTWPATGAEKILIAIFLAVARARQRAAGGLGRGQVSDLDPMTVEFLPSDEAPEHPSEPPAASSAHWWWLLGAVVVVAALGYTLTRPSTAQPSTQLTYRAVAACRGVPDCALRDRVPPQLARLARADLPRGARLTVRSAVSVDSITHEELLVSRTVTATTDWVTVRIELKRS